MYRLYVPNFTGGQDGIPEEKVRKTIIKQGQEDPDYKSINMPSEVMQFWKGHNLPFQLYNRGQLSSIYPLKNW